MKYKKIICRIIFILLFILLNCIISLVIINVSINYEINRNYTYKKIGDISIRTKGNLKYIDNSYGFGAVDDKTKIEIYYYKDELNNEDPIKYIKSEELRKDILAKGKPKKIIKLKNGIYIAKYKVEYTEEDEGIKWKETEADYVCIVKNDVYVIHNNAPKDKYLEIKLDKISKKIKVNNEFYTFDHFSTNYQGSVDEEISFKNNEMIYKNGNIYRYKNLKLELSDDYTLVRNSTSMLYKNKNKVGIYKDAMAYGNNISAVYKANTLKELSERYSSWEYQYDDILYDSKYKETDDYEVFYVFEKRRYGDEASYIDYYIRPKKIENGEYVYMFVIFDVDKGSDISSFENIFDNINICSEECNNKNCGCN